MSFGRFSMLYVNICICELVFIVWSYLFVKTYQLDGYDIKKFFNHIFEFKLALGDKNKLVFTKRLIRFLVLYLLFALALFILINVFISNIYLVLLNSIVVFLFCPVLIAVTNYILMPFEQLIKKYYIKKAKRKLGKLDIIKIGITGSFGKTSTKNILASILEKEYKVCTTPKNFNTEMGVTRAILENLDDHDVFIAEMGAKHVGDIETLAKLVKPRYAIITTIGNQHIETFNTLKNIEETKNELPLNIEKGGTVVFNGDSKSTLKLYKAFKGNKYLTNQPNSFAYAENICMDENGSRFDLVLDGNRLSISTKLLGQCNINNIVTSSAMGYILGISKDDIVSAIKKLSPPPHRLEVIKNNYATIIDDSYNSNVVGSQEALEVLSKFKGTKIVVTPGLVEMGQEQSNVNFKLGGLIADVADYIIIMNDVNKNYLFSGAISHNFDKNKIYFASTRKRQKEILQLLMIKGCVILFENDLPDNYK